MTDTERIIYKDHVQSLAISALQNAIVQASIVEGGVKLTVIFNDLGETTFHVAWGKTGDKLLPTFIARELQQRACLLAKDHYFR